MSNLPKWTEDRTNKLIALVGDETPVTRVNVADIAEELETTTRSVSAKLRKMGYEVELATAAARAFSDEVTEQLREYVVNNSGQYTYAEIAANFPGDYTAKAIQGKILSLELTGHVKETVREAAPKSYTDEEQALVLDLIRKGKFVEDIAEAVGKTVQSVRGKALSLQRSGEITAMPKQRDVKGPAADPLTALGDISELTVSEIAEKLEKTERGIRTMLTRRKLTAADYDGAAKAEKAAAANS